MAEEWHTANSTCLLSDQLWIAGLRDKAVLVWTANNVMGFDRIDWPRLGFCSQISTVSRYMKHLMWSEGVNPTVIPNGIPENRIRSHSAAMSDRLHQAVGGAELLFKIGRWSPDKRWNMAVEALANERARGSDVTMLIRGGIEPHAVEVLDNAGNLGLKVLDVRMPKEAGEAIDTLGSLPRADIYNIRNFMSDELVSLLYHSADGVLANSGHEPFGLVGLEVMAAGGVGFVGSTGEDYAIPFLNAVVLDSDDPNEINIALQYLRTHPEAQQRIRKEALATAKRYTWRSVIEDVLLSKLKYAALRQGAGSELAGQAEPAAEPGEPAGVASLVSDEHEEEVADEGLTELASMETSTGRNRPQARGRHRPR
jgi:glycosyltransferase involved in cell wall biosynthesis